MTSNGTGHATHDDGRQARNLSRVSQLLPLLFAFFRDPVGAVKEPIRMSWPAAFSLQFGAAMVSGALVAVISKSFVDLVIGLFVFPLATIMIGAVFTLFIYYFYSVFTRTFLDIRRLHSLVVLATVPYFVIHAFAGFLAPLDLIGFALTMILLVVGLCEQFGLVRKQVIMLMSLIYAVFFVAWSVTQLTLDSSL